MILPSERLELTTRRLDPQSLGEPTVVQRRLIFCSSKEVFRFFSSCLSCSRFQTRIEPTAPSTRTLASNDVNRSEVGSRPCFKHCYVWNKGANKPDVYKPQDATRTNKCQHKGPTLGCRLHFFGAPKGSHTKLFLTNVWIRETRAAVVTVPDLPLGIKAMTHLLSSGWEADFSFCFGQVTQRNVLTGQVYKKSLLLIALNVFLRSLWLCGRMPLKHVSGVVGFWPSATVAICKSRQVSRCLYDLESRHT